MVDDSVGFSNAGGVLEMVSKKDGNRKLMIRHTKLVYFPKEGDIVIGVIVKKNAENYNVDISRVQTDQMHLNTLSWKQ